MSLPLLYLLLYPYSIFFFFIKRFAEALSGHYDYIDEKVDDLEEDLLSLSDFRIHMTAKEAGMSDFALADGFFCFFLFFLAILFVYLFGRLFCFY